MTDEMSRDEADAFLRETRIASLSTVGANGRPVTIPVWYEWDGKVARVFSSKSAAKIRRLAANPAVSLTVYEGAGVPEAWVSIEGNASVSEDGVEELIGRLARRYYPAERAERIVKQWLGSGPVFAMITIEPERVRSYRTEW
jgi:hypothetical protein